MIELTKSEFIQFLKHPGFLWLKKYDKDKLPSLEDIQHILDMGNKFEKYAEEYFADSIRLGFNNYMEYRSLPERTKKELTIGKHKTIFQGRLVSSNLTCIFDILEKEGDKYNLYEIKASTKVKEEYYYDLAFQRKVIEGAGFKLNNIKIIYVNNEFTLTEKGIAVEDIIKIEDVKEKVLGKEEYVDENIKKAFQIIAMGKENPPSFSPVNIGKLGKLQEWLEVYRNLETISENSIYNLSRISLKKIIMFDEIKVNSQNDIPDDMFSELSDRQQKQILSIKDGRIIEKEEIKNFMNKFKYPLHFLDYETYMDVIPRFIGTRPYQQIPIQYSLHILHEDGKLEHKEYLHTTTEDPLKIVAENLQKDVSPEGTFIVWNESFEKKCNELIGECFSPSKTFFEDINSRIVDLMEPFCNSYFVDKGFLGSASIKKVLPVLIPELSYKTLNIQDGASAQKIWGETFLGPTTDAEKTKVIKDLKEYCKLDTLSMVEIYKYLKSV